MVVYSQESQLYMVDFPLPSLTNLDKSDVFSIPSPHETAAIVLAYYSRPLKNNDANTNGDFLMVSLLIIYIECVYIYMYTCVHIYTHMLHSISSFRAINRTYSLEIIRISRFDLSLDWETPLYGPQGMISFPTSTMVSGVCWILGGGV